MTTGTGAAETSPAPVSYGFYLDGYGEALSAEAFAEALPAAVRCVGALTRARDVREGCVGHFQAQQHSPSGSERNAFSIPCGLALLPSAELGKVCIRFRLRPDIYGQFGLSSGMSL